MPLTPCDCEGNTLDWPYDDLDPDDVNGFHCGDDGAGSTIYWTEPTGDNGAMVATKPSAAGIATGADPDADWRTLGTTWFHRAGSTYWDDESVYTAPRAGMYKVTFKLQPTNLETFNIWLRCLTDYTGWDSPYLEAVSYDIPFLGGGALLRGVLPADTGGTLTFQILHNRGSAATFEDILVSVVWLCPIPTS